MPIKKYAAKGIFEDLNPYLEKDFGKDSMVEPFYKALLSDDGKLYELYSSFYVQSYYGLKKVVGDGSSWTYKDMLAAMDTLQPGASVFEPYYDRNTAITLFINSNMDSYVDWESGECYFDSEDFIGLLEATSLFPKEYKWDENQEDLNESSITRLAGGKQLLASAYMSDLNSLRAETWYQTDEELSFVGLPTNSGTGNTFGTNGAGFCISSTSQYKDVCWDFIKEIYEEEYFNDHSYWGIPTNKQWYEKAFETAMTPQFPEDGEDTADTWYSNLTVKNEAYGPAISEDGKTEVPQSSYGTQDGEFAIYAMKPEERVRMEEIINSAKTVARYDSSLTTIITEECEAFFSGQKSAADTAQMIQSRVKLYVNEQK
jgi:ABC-type glycerol-3-phosphate transport system substrate-binding protein